jgi:hypothetical protein
MIATWFLRFRNSASRGCDNAPTRVREPQAGLSADSERDCARGGGAHVLKLPRALGTMLHGDQAPTLIGRE